MPGGTVAPDKRRWRRDHVGVRGTARPNGGTRVWGSPIGLVVVASLLLSACFGGGGDSSPVETTATVDDTAPAPTEEVAVTSEPVTSEVEETSTPVTSTEPSQISTALQADVDSGTTPDNATVQAALAALCFYSGEIDGDFGPLSEDALKVFQADAGLDPDGVVGPLTSAALLAALATAPASC